MPLIDFHTHRPTAEGIITPRCFGIHPWDCAQSLQPNLSTINISGQLLQTLQPQLSTFNSQFTSAEIIGECGLDRCCDTPWPLQMEVFEWQIETAERLHKPMVIHCVRAYNELIALRKKHTATPWVVHGFTGSVQLYRQLLDHGIEVSFGAVILDQRRKKVRETLATSNPENIFLETDDSGADIAEIYCAAACLLKIESSRLQDIIGTHYHNILAISAL